MNKITIIALMPCNEYYVGTTCDIDHFIEECKSKYRAGYFHQKRNMGKIQIVFSVPGDYTKHIRVFGTKQFMKLINDYRPLQDAIIQMLT